MQSCLIVLVVLPLKLLARLVDDHCCKRLAHQLVSCTADNTPTFMHSNEFDEFGTSLINLMKFDKNHMFWGICNRRILRPHLLGSCGLCMVPNTGCSVA